MATVPPRRKVLAANNLPTRINAVPYILYLFLAAEVYDWPTWATVVACLVFALFVGFMGFLAGREEPVDVVNRPE